MVVQVRTKVAAGWHLWVMRPGEGPHDPKAKLLANLLLTAIGENGDEARRGDHQYKPDEKKGMMHFVLAPVHSIGVRLTKPVSGQNAVNHIPQ